MANQVSILKKTGSTLKRVLDKFNKAADAVEEALAKAIQEVDAATASAEAGKAATATAATTPAVKTNRGAQQKRSTRTGSSRPTAVGAKPVKQAPVTVGRKQATPNTAKPTRGKKGAAAATTEPRQGRGASKSEARRGRKDASQASSPHKATASTDAASFE